MLFNGLKLGEIHITNTSVSIIERNSKIKSPMRVGGFVCANKKDDKNPKKKVYLEPKSERFQNTIFQNTLEKFIAWFGVYEIEANTDMLEMILDTGMGAKCMQGLGFLEVVK
ncbi:hypothetical protein MNB_SV-14-509 [hydrothermal vent metagenome]|uniref:CRISPR associated protein Cas6 C-terminal domain-containing protein n=1 Tax=hydrothermal vent metagenome TaxID=652676 RepID=A0A1W1CLR9_9ZZZZ